MDGICWGCGLLVRVNKDDKKIEERSECLHAGDAAEGAGNKRGGKERKKKIVCMGGQSQVVCMGTLLQYLFFVYLFLHCRSGSSVYLWQTARITSLKSGEGTEDGLHVSKESLSVVSKSV